MQVSKAIHKFKVASLVLALFLAACSHTASKVSVPPLSAEFPAADFSKAVAKVNGKVITAAELKRAKKILLANKPGLQITPPLQKDFELQALNQLISAELLFQESRKLAITGLDQQAATKIAETRKRFRSEKEYAQGLQDIGMDEKSFADSVRRDFSIAYLVNTKIAAGVTASEEEAQKFFDANPEKFRIDEQWRASHLLIGVDGKAGAEEKKAAREKAEKLHRDLVNGADFEKLARENSTCPSSKQGGDLGYFSKGKLDPKFEAAAFALAPGALSGVVETRFGYHIIKLVDRKKAEEIPFAKARARIMDYLKAQKTNSALELFVGEARKNAKVEILL